MTFNRTRIRSGALVVLASVALAGCRSPLDVSALKSHEVDRLASTEDVRGPLERLLQRDRPAETAESNSLKAMAGTRELEAAKKLYEDGEYKAAEKAFKKIAKRYEDTPVEEEALFLRAESQFARKRFSWAQDQYTSLIEKYPSTRYLDTSTKRLFEIGRYWLDFPEVASSSDVQPVNFEKPSATPKPESDRPRSWDPSKVIPIVPNLWDRTRPVFDTRGRGLEALRAVWQNDPTGPLADDALMLTASHYLRQGNYIESDHLFTILREDYPKSPHLEDAFVLGSHVKLVSYQGASYDGKSLEEAEALKKSALRVFPDVQERERIERELMRIEQADAARLWKDIEFWQRKGKPRAVATYCREILRKHPESEHAVRARELLAELPPEALDTRVRLRPPEKPSLLKRLRVDQIPRLLPVPGRDSDEEQEEPRAGEPESDGGSAPEPSRPLRPVPPDSERRRGYPSAPEDGVREVSGRARL